MLAIVDELAKDNLTVADQTAYLKPLMPPPGVLTKRNPTEEEKEDIRFGFETAKAMGGMDIGQTVVVKHKAVMAIEAIEGTDACIRRGGQLAGGGAVVAKAAKPQQDSRFDVPAVGLDTIESLVAAKASALVIEAGKTLFIDKERAIALAEANGITIAAM